MLWVYVDMDGNNPTIDLILNPTIWLKSYIKSAVWLMPRPHYILYIVVSPRVRLYKIYNTALSCYLYSCTWQQAGWKHISLHPNSHWKLKHLVSYQNSNRTSLMWPLLNPNMTLYGLRWGAGGTLLSLSCRAVTARIWKSLLLFYISSFFGNKEKKEANLTAVLQCYDPK